MANESLQFDASEARRLESTYVTPMSLRSIGAFVAVSSLVRLMRRRRDQVLAELTAQAREEQNRKRLAEILAQKQERKRKAAELPSLLKTEN